MDNLDSIAAFHALPDATLSADDISDFMNKRSILRANIEDHVLEQVRTGVLDPWNNTPPISNDRAMGILAQYPVLRKGVEQAVHSQMQKVAQHGMQNGIPKRKKRKNNGKKKGANRSTNHDSFAPAENMEIDVQDQGLDETDSELGIPGSQSFDLQTLNQAPAMKSETARPQSSGLQAHGNGIERFQTLVIRTIQKSSVDEFSNHKAILGEFDEGTSKIHSQKEINGLKYTTLLLLLELKYSDMNAQDVSSAVDRFVYVTESFLSEHRVDIQFPLPANTLNAVIVNGLRERLKGQLNEAVENLHSSAPSNDS